VRRWLGSLAGSLGLLLRVSVVGLLGLVAFLTVVMFLNATQSQPAGHPAQASLPPASAGTELWEMGLAHIPTNAACELCHVTGGSSGLKPVPPLGHPLEGWRACLTCHSGDELGQTAPGHEGIPEPECLSCHKERFASVAITQPHSRFQDQQCLDCHGAVAHLPSTMDRRDPTECSACHTPTNDPPPEFEHAMNLSVGCRSCHQSTEVGSLPVDHALRGDETCFLCHDYKVAGNPSTNPLESPATLGPSP